MSMRSAASTRESIEWPRALTGASPVGGRPGLAEGGVTERGSSFLGTPSKYNRRGNTGRHKEMTAPETTIAPLRELLRSPGTGLSSHQVALTVVSALRRFTTVFGTGTGGPTAHYCTRTFAAIGKTDKSEEAHGAERPHGYREIRPRRRGTRETRDRD